MKDGVRILHGSREQNSVPLFKSVYQAFKKVRYRKMKSYFMSNKHQYYSFSCPQFNFIQDGMTTLMEDLATTFEETGDKCFFKDSFTFFKRMTSQHSSLFIFIILHLLIPIVACLLSAATSNIIFVLFVLNGDWRFRPDYLLSVLCHSKNTLLAVRINASISFFVARLNWSKFKLYWALLTVLGNLWEI